MCALFLASAPASASILSWTDLADLTLASPAVLVATTENAGKLSRKSAPDVPPGEVRALIEARLTAALKAPGILPARGEWLWQGTADAKNRPPFAKGSLVIAFLEPVASAGSPDIQQYRLTAPHAMQPWSPDTEATVRAILEEATRPENGGLLVTAVTDGFHSSGTVAGQSESQFFLATESGRPLTLLVEKSPGNAPAVTLATGDMIERALPIVPRTLRWRALACGLPAALPPKLSASPELSADYEAARASIGPCGRTR